MKKKPILHLVAIIWFIAMCISCAPIEILSLEGLVRISNHIFEGTVQQLNASNLSIITETEDYAIVEVNTIIDAPPNFDAFLNREITVKMHKDSKLSDGQVSIFFTNDWLYGESMAVIETGRLADQGEDLKEKISGTRLQLTHDAIKERLKRAIIVVNGRIVSVSDKQVDELNRSEHDPEWVKADIAIEEVLKGNYSEETITLNFPSSRDVMWVSVPKYKEGQEGIWLLYENQEKTIEIKGYTALHPDDYYTLKDEELIKRLLSEL